MYCRGRLRLQKKHAATSEDISFILRRTTLPQQSHTLQNLFLQNLLLQNILLQNIPLQNLSLANHSPQSRISSCWEVVTTTASTVRVVRTTVSATPGSHHKWVVHRVTTLAEFSELVTAVTTTPTTVVTTPLADSATLTGTVNHLTCLVCCLPLLPFWIFLRVQRVELKALEATMKIDQLIACVTYLYRFFLIAFTHSAYL